MGFLRLVAWCLLPAIAGACAPKVFYPGSYQGASEADRLEAYNDNRIKNTGNFLFSYSVGASSYSSDMMWPIFQSSGFLSDETRESFSDYKTSYYIALALAFPTGFLGGAAAATGDGGLIAAGLGTIAVFVGVIVWSESVFQEAVRGYNRDLAESLGIQNIVGVTWNRQPSPVQIGNLDFQFVLARHKF